MKNKNHCQLITALDVDSLAQLRALTEQLDDVVDIYKVGSQLFTACGPAAVRFIEARKKKVFLDLKFHDIPNTVAKAVEAAMGLSGALARTLSSHELRNFKDPGIFMLTVHALGGFAMMQAAADSAVQTAARLGVPKPIIVGVTVLTSEERRDDLLPVVLDRAGLAKKAGCDGVVASCEEAAVLRKEFGKDFVIVTPGIRSADSDRQDQKRIATPRQAVLSGSDFLVVGRPIVNSENPRQAAKDMLKEMQAA